MDLAHTSKAYSHETRHELRTTAATDPMLIIEFFLWRTRSEYAISNHYTRHCVWEEVHQNKHLINTTTQPLMNSSTFTSLMVSPSLTLQTYTPLPNVPEGSFIVRAYSPMSNLFSCLWFNEVNRFTSCDQLSFAYTFLKLKRLNPGRPFFLNMFKVGHETRVERPTSFLLPRPILIPGTFHDRDQSVKPKQPSGSNYSGTIIPVVPVPSDAKIVQQPRDGPANTSNTSGGTNVSCENLRN
ncbi:hypothetical protein HYC85_023236 [Camellia sinensis]|uniref:TOD1/MUCI70 glycosyltransferase-like domain-containing protein n=1 Tax=Camellia sinensis TaxID=4442 RepID=A0A7J7GEM2_CAMSI|nr:hypothetical protein HYC85_023236 [Camellia sinensis]